MPETLEATVDCIRWSSPESPWAVLGMMNGRDRFAAVGDLGGVEPGEVLELHGEWTRNCYGLQFKTENFKRVRPRSALGIQKFLAGIPGVGFHTAKCLVDHWGEETLAKLEEGPEVAREVPGIGPQRAPAIYQAVLERTRRDDVLMDLPSLGIGAALAARIERVNDPGVDDPALGRRGTRALTGAPRVVSLDPEPAGDPIGGATIRSTSASTSASEARSRTTSTPR